MLKTFFCLPNILDRLIWFSFLIWLIVDTITGYYLNAGIQVPISQVFKLGVLLLVLFRIFKRYFLLISVVFLYFILYAIHIVQMEEKLSDSLILLSKFFSTLFIYLYLTSFVRKIPELLFFKLIFYVFLVGLMTLVVNVILGYLGFGYYTYSTFETGNKGFFYAGNELGGICAVLFPFFLWRALDRSYLIFLFLSILFSFIGLSIGTKSCLIVALMSIIVLPLFRMNILVSIQYLLLGVILFVCFSFFIDGFMRMDTYLNIISRFETEDVVDVIFSGRNQFWEMEKSEVFYNDIMVHLLGLGGNRSVEMDPMDILLNYGYLGMIYVCTFFFIMIYRVLKNIRNRESKYVVIFIDLIILFMSIVAGHIVFSSMAGLYITLINSFAFCKSSEIVIYGKKENFGDIKSLSIF